MFGLLAHANRVMLSIFPQSCRNLQKVGEVHNRKAPKGLAFAIPRHDCMLLSRMFSRLCLAKPSEGSEKV